LRLLRSARSVYDSLRLQLGSKPALDVFTSNSARPILSKRFSAWFTSDSVPWAAPLNIRTQPTELKSCLARAGQKCKSFVSEDRRDRLHRRKIAVIRNKAPQSQVISLCRESKVKRRHNITCYVYVMLLFCDFCGLVVKGLIVSQSPILPLPS